MYSSATLAEKQTRPPSRYPQLTLANFWFRIIVGRRCVAVQFLLHRSRGVVASTTAPAVEICLRVIYCSSRQFYTLSTPLLVCDFAPAIASHSLPANMATRSWTSQSPSSSPQSSRSTVARWLLSQPRVSPSTRRISAPYPRVSVQDFPAVGSRAYRCCCTTVTVRVGGVLSSCV